MSKASKALKTLNDNWGENWDVIVDFFGEELGKQLDEAILEMNQPEEEIKPCPFCGVQPVSQLTKVKTYSNGEKYQHTKIRCNGGLCHIKPDVIGYDYQHALKKWNERSK